MDSVESKLVPSKNADEKSNLCSNGSKDLTFSNNVLTIKQSENDVVNSHAVEFELEPKANILSSSCNDMSHKSSASTINSEKIAAKALSVERPLAKCVLPKVKVQKAIQLVGSSKNKSPTESYKVNVVQSNEGLGKPTTSKIKIQPIFGNANVVDMTKKNGPFPVIYIGTPNIIDMQAYLKQVETESKESSQHSQFHDIGGKFSVPEVVLNGRSNSIAARNHLANNNDSGNVSETSSSPDISSSILQKRTENLFETEGSYDIKKAMMGFLDTSPCASMKSKPRNPYFPNADLESFPSMVLSDPRLFETKQSSLFSPAASNSMMSIAPNAWQNIYSKQVRMPSVPRSQPALNSSMKIPIPPLKRKKKISMFRYPSVPRPGAVYGRMDISSSELVANTNSGSPQPKGASAAESALFTTSFNGSNVLSSVITAPTERRALSLMNCDSQSTSSPTTKSPIVGYECTTKPTTEETLVSSVSQVRKRGLNFTPSKCEPRSKALRTIKPLDANKYNYPSQKTKSKNASVEISTVPHTQSSAASENAHSGAKGKVMLRPYAGSLKRSGVQVKFEDNVIVWIDKLRDLMYLDDEPVKSWKLDKGTKVAAKYTDGLFYDAVVLNSYDAAAAKQKSSVSVIEAAEDDKDHKEDTIEVPDTIKKKIDTTIEAPSNSNKRNETAVKTSPSSRKRLEATVKAPTGSEKRLKTTAKVPAAFNKGLKTIIKVPAKSTKGLKTIIKVPAHYDRRRKSVVNEPTKMRKKVKSTPSPKRPQGAVDAYNRRTSQKVEKIRASLIKKPSSATKLNAVIQLPRVHIKKLDFSEDQDKLILDKNINQSKVNRSSKVKKTTPTRSKASTFYLKCPKCHLIFKSDITFQRHRNTVCKCNGIAIPDYLVSNDFKSNTNSSVTVDDSSESPLIATLRASKSKLDADKKMIPCDADGKKIFRRGSCILHRWQTDAGSRWYHGRIVRIFVPKVGEKEECDVVYADDEDHEGPIRICLQEDYPHDVRIVTR